jgi:biopolymer transport protein ExbD/biopolymer transport protein TolR
MKPSHRELFNEINITPLTDIFLVLLIIMMVVAPMLDYRALDMTLSAGAPSDEKPKEDTTHLRLNVLADGQYTVDGSSVDQADLVSTLRTRGAEKPDGVIIEVDPESNHASLAHAIDSVQMAGIQQVSVIESSPATSEAAPEAPPAEKPVHKTKKKK